MRRNEPGPPVRMGGIRQATACFFDEARHWDELRGRELAYRFDRKLQEYLAFFEEPRP